MAAALQPFVENGTFAGAVVLVADRQKVLDIEAVGYSDLAARKPMKTSDLFWIASNTKAITAAAVMMLVEEGKLKLDDPVEKYIPELKGLRVEPNDAANKGGARPDTDNADALQPATPHSNSKALIAESHPFTVREVLSHTAGFRGEPTHAPATVDHYSLKDRMTLYAEDPLIAQPGTQFHYSNEGFNVAGRLVEVASGMAYEDFLQQRLFTPLAMTETTFWPTPAQTARLAKTYTSKGSTDGLRAVPIARFIYPLDDRQHRFAVASGGIFTTASDFARFGQMLLDGGTFGGKRYLSEASVKLMTTKETPAGVASKYGFGLYQTSSGFTHGGAYKTELNVDTTRGLVTVFFVQREDAWPGSSGQQIKHIIEDKADSLAPVTTSR